MKTVITMGLLVFLVGCTDAKFAKFTNMGNQAQIECFSGGKQIYEGHSTGKVISEESSDGYFFKEKGTGKLKEVSGNCVITYD